MRHWTRTAIALLLLVAIAYPWLGPSEYDLGIVFTIAIYVVLAESWLVSSGFTGYYSFGQAAFFGLGGYALAICVHDLVSLPQGIAVVMGTVIGLLASLLLAGVLGWITLRVRAVFFSVLTLMLIFLMSAITVNLAFTGGASGMVLPINSLSPHDMAVVMYYVALGLAIVAAGIAYGVQRSALYLKLIAIRDDEPVAETCGVSALRLKVVMFAVGAALASVAGSVNFYQADYIDPTTAFSIIITAYALLMPVLGGVESWFGPVIGAVALQLLSLLLSNLGLVSLDPVVFGVTLMAAMLFMRGGVLGIVDSITSRLAHAGASGIREEEDPA
jgi:branched-chain amino acid transport system permease protein